MTCLPHPSLVIANLERRRADLLAESERDRLARVAEHKHGTRSPRQILDDVTSLALVIVIALSVMLAATVERPPTSPARPAAFTAEP